VLSGTAPRAAQLAAARGLLPLPQADLLEILVGLPENTDGELLQHSLETLASQESGSLDSAVRSAEIAPRVLGYFAARPTLPASLHEAILLNPRTPAAAVAAFARTTTSGLLLELIAVATRRPLSSSSRPSLPPISAVQA